MWGQIFSDIYYKFVTLIELYLLLNIKLKNKNRLNVEGHSEIINTVMANASFEQKPYPIINECLNLIDSRTFKFPLN